MNFFIRLHSISTKYTLRLALLCFSILFVAPELANADAMAGKKKPLRKARHYYTLGNYDAAEIQYKEYLRLDANSFQVNAELGTMLLTKSYKQPESVQYLEAAYNNMPRDTVHHAEVMYHLAQAYHFVGRYEEAISYYRNFQRFLRKTTKGYFLNQEVIKAIGDCSAGLEHKNDKSYRRVIVENLGENINSKYPEYVPIVIGMDSMLLFTARRKESTGGKVDLKDEKYFEDMYISERKGAMFAMAKPFSKRLDYVGKIENTADHEALVNVTYDGAHLITYKEHSLWISELKGDQWGKPKRMHENINMGQYQKHATITEDGKRIFFSSMTKDGMGELDIYYCDGDGNGNWGPAKNMGPAINTRYAEDSPQISKDGKTLYFSSKGHRGMGGYDIYRTELVNGRWTEPMNMGTPINSSADDIFFSLTDNGDIGYFASSREGGFGDMDIYKAKFGSYPEFNACIPVEKGEFEVVLKVSDYLKRINDNRIYQWDLGDGSYAEGTEVTYKYQRPGSFKVKLNAFNPRNNRTKYVRDDINVSINNVNHIEFLNPDTVMTNTEVVFDGSITMFKFSEITDRYWEVEDSVKRGGMQLRRIFKTPGTYEIRYEVDSRDTVNFKYEKHCVSKNITVLNEEDFRKYLESKNRKRIEDQLFLGRRYNSYSDGGVYYSRLKLEPIYYDYNRSTIRQDARRTMERNVAILKKVPDAIIKVVAHADSRGKAEYNFKLAERRARAAIRYIVRKGIPRSRIAASISKGESDLANNCYDNTPCSRRQHQMNRRADFIVVGFVQEF